MRTEHTSSILVSTAVALMMATGAAAQTPAAPVSSAWEGVVIDALVAVPRPAEQVLAFRMLTFPASGVAQPSFRLEFAPARAFQATAPPQRSWADKHPVKFGALVGAGVGLAVGIIAFKTADCPAGRVCSTAGVALVFYPALGAGIGALAGLLQK